MLARPLLSQVWRASELATATGAVVASGHAALDAELPSGGWPLGALVELLAADVRAPWSPLLLPALAAHLGGQGGVLALLDPPFEPYAPALAAAGVPPARLLWLRSGAAGQASWLAEQAAGCADVAVLLAWLPRARPAHLRRLHAAARRRGQLLLFAFLDAAGPAAAAPACAPLRLALQLVPAPRAGSGRAALPRLRVDILRRRGPPLQQPLWLPACSPALQALLAGGAGAPAAAATPDNVLPFPQREGAGHAANPALDRLAIAS